MNEEIAELHKKVRRGKLAIYAIIVFLVVLTVSLLIITQRINDKQALQTQSHAATYLIPLPKPTSTLECRSDVSIQSPTIEGCGLPCNPESSNTQFGITNSNISAYSSCPNGLVCQKVTCQSQPGQVCPQSNMGRCVNPKCSECSTCKCSECRAINPSTETRSYNNQGDCTANCKTPGWVCVGGNPNYYYDIYKNRILIGNNICALNLCRFNGMTVYHTDKSEPKNYWGFTAIHKNNSCPAKDFIKCFEGFDCNKTPNGIELYKRGETEDVDIATWFQKGTNCICASNIEEKYWGLEFFNNNYCETLTPLDCVRSEDGKCIDLKKLDLYTTIQCNYDSQYCRVLK